MAFQLLVILLVSLAFSQSNGHTSPKHSLEWACELAQDPEFCHSILIQNVRSIPADPKDLSEIALKISIAHVQQAWILIPARPNGKATAIKDCRVLHDLTMQHLSKAHSKLNKLQFFDHAEDVQSLLSAALTNQAICLKCLQQANIEPGQFSFINHIYNASRSVSTTLALIKKLWIADNSKSNGRLLYGFGFPRWVSRKDRRRLDEKTFSADVTVAKDGSSGPYNYTTVAAAIDAAPTNSAQKYVIYVKKGVYNENIQVLPPKTNITLIGDGKDVTVITGSRGANQWPMADTATFTVYGDGFVARDITFENSAGRDKYQAVALTVAADKAAFYRCSIKSYQDTLFAVSHRQFYRECDIYGTIDFICGNAAAVFDSCNLLVRKPIQGQANLLTAQDRADPNENTGFSFIKCTVTATPELAPVIASVKTFLGRPWGNCSRTVFMESYLDELIDPAGWLDWEGKNYSALDTIYYGEYKNQGPGANTASRIAWPGYHVMNAYDTKNFSVPDLIAGDGWLPSDNIPYQP